MRRRTSRICRGAIGLFVLLCATSAAPARAQVQLDSLFTNGGVLQQGMKVPIFGTGTPNDDVFVTLQDQRASTKVDADGRWRVELQPLRAGGPYQMTVTADKAIQLRMLMVGEVWIVAGGTNMQWLVMRSEGYGGVITHTGNKDLRLFTSKREGALEPEFTNDALWHSAGAASVGTFSAVGYFFGRSLLPHLKVPGEPNLKVPVGLISCNHFESTIESWISREALKDSPELKDSLEKPINSYQTRSPTVLFNGMVHPLTQYAVRGVLWYHGENEIDRAYEYRFGLSTMIADWRKHWNRPDLPFVIVQQTPYKITSKTYKESKLAELRDSQWHVSRQVPNTVLVVTTDCGDQFDLHPPQKEPVGRRASLAARGLVYGEKFAYQGPTYVSTRFVRNEAIVRFDNIGGGLEAKGDELTGFFVAGSDNTFYTAKAEIKDDTVVVTSTQVAVPVAVRYAWADFPTGNLQNKEGLPASPFRTDNYHLTSQPKEAQ
jgi:sialate O-acetylesterase